MQFFYCIIIFFQSTTIQTLLNRAEETKSQTKLTNMNLTLLYQNLEQPVLSHQAIYKILGTFTAYCYVLEQFSDIVRE